MELGLSGVAAPIKNHEAKIVASLSVSGPSSRLPGERLAEIGATVKETADLISARLGYVEPVESNS